MSVRAIVLAAGKGTRMKSSIPKVLHEVCGRAMLWYTLEALRAAGIHDIVVVTNDDLEARIGEFGVRSVVQREQFGTGHAVKVALDAIESIEGGRIVVAYGDMPLVTEKIFGDVLDALAARDTLSPAMSLVTVNMPLPSNFGRIVRDGESVRRIVEVRDASQAELALDEMNAGIYAFDEAAIREAANTLRNDNAQGEYYLTDTVAHFVAQGKSVRPVRVSGHEHTLGINDRIELALARKRMNARLCEQHMRAGVTIVDPDTTYLEPELSIGRDTVIYPNSSLSRLSTVGDDCVIGPNTRLSNAHLGNRVGVRESVILDSNVGSGTTIGPFSHIRGGAELSENARVGNFVEIKNSKMGAGAKASHLSYLGDASIGDASNIGAGTITCNYDGKNKHQTIIGKNVSIGSNTSIVAPRTIGDNALTGAGSVVTRDVADGERVAGNPARPIQKKK